MTCAVSRSLGAAPSAWDRGSEGVNVQIIMRPENVRRDGRGEVAPELVFVRTTTALVTPSTSTTKEKTQLVRNIYHPLRMRVPKVTLMRQPKVNLRLIKRVFDLVGVDTC